MQFGHGYVIEEDSVIDKNNEIIGFILFYKIDFELVHYTLSESQEL